jgi:hypothetical protein
MWILQNNTPFAAASAWVRDRNGAEEWIVAVKASFVIEQDGKQALDAEQREVFPVPKFRGSPETSSLLYECDLLHTKTRTDVILHGHAFSPGGKPATSVDVRLKVANIDKTLRVYGDRIIGRGAVGLTLSSPQPFTRKAIIYEQAYGGTDRKDENPERHQWEPGNPVGVGFATRIDHIVGTPAPNIEYPSEPYRDWRRGQPAGFGSIARHWAPRVKLAGTYDSQWEETRSPLLPYDFDDRFYQSAPEDQQVDGFLRGGEIVELYNLTPESYLSFQLPMAVFVMTTRFYDGTRVEHRAVMHTVLIQPDERRFQMVWHSQLPCHQKVNKLEITRVTLKKRLNLSRSGRDTGVWTGE